MVHGLLLRSRLAVRSVNDQTSRSEVVYILHGLSLAMVYLSFDLELIDPFPTKHAFRRFHLSSLPESLPGNCCPSESPHDSTHRNTLLRLPERRAFAQAIVQRLHTETATSQMRQLLRSNDGARHASSLLPLSPFWPPSPTILSPLPFRTPCFFPIPITAPLTHHQAATPPPPAATSPHMPD